MNVAGPANPGSQAKRQLDSCGLDELPIHVAKSVGAGVLDDDEAINVGERTGIEKDPVQHGGYGQRCSDAESDDKRQ